MFNTLLRGFDESLSSKKHSNVRLTIYIYTLQTIRLWRLSCKWFETHCHTCCIKKQTKYDCRFFLKQLSSSFLHVIRFTRYRQKKYENPCQVSGWHGGGLHMEWVRSRLEQEPRGRKTGTSGVWQGITLLHSHMPNVSPMADHRFWPECEKSVTAPSTNSTDVIM